MVTGGAVYGQYHRLRSSLAERGPHYTAVPVSQRVVVKDGTSSAPNSAPMRDQGATNCPHHGRTCRGWLLDVKTMNPRLSYCRRGVFAGATRQER